MRALITGITGQDGSYLAELLLEKGYEVFGLVRKTSSLDRIQSITGKIRLIEGDLTDQDSLDAAVRTSQPDELYNLAAQSSVAESWKEPELTVNVNGNGVVRLLDSIRKCSPTTKFLQASSSEMLAEGDFPLSETAELRPRNPYGAAKAAAHLTAIEHREKHRLFTCSCICFSHESPRRGFEFVTRKVSWNVARIKVGLEHKLKMGNLDARRDWGYAGDTVRAMWMMLQQSQPEDYVIATGELHSVRNLLQTAFSRVRLDWEKYVEVDPALFRPVESDNRVGNATKARTKLGWKPEVAFPQLVEMMVDSDLARLREQMAVSQVKAGV
jgi:GDPmannose 4,6-dehydratase